MLRSSKTIGEKATAVSRRRWWLLALIGAGAALLLWLLADAPWIVLSMALGVAVVLRFLAFCCRGGFRIVRL
jgi:hypothetical protein